MRIGPSLSCVFASSLGVARFLRCTSPQGFTATIGFSCPSHQEVLHQQSGQESRLYFRRGRCFKKDKESRLYACCPRLDQDTPFSKCLLSLELLDPTGTTRAGTTSWCAPSPLLRRRASAPSRVHPSMKQESNPSPSVTMRHYAFSAGLHVIHSAGHRWVLSGILASNPTGSSRTCRHWTTLGFFWPTGLETRCAAVHSREAVEIPSDTKRIGLIRWSILRQEHLRRTEVTDVPLSSKPEWHPATVRDHRGGSDTRQVRHFYFVSIWIQLQL